MYSYENLQTWIYRSDSTADDLGATGDSAEVFNVVAPCTAYAIGCLITTDFVVGASAQLSFDRRITTGSDTGRLTGTAGLGLISGTANATYTAGKVLINRITPVDLNPGDQIIINVVDAGTSGAGRHFVLYRMREETAPNLSDIVSFTG